MTTNEFDSFMRDSMNLADRARKAQEAVRRILTPLPVPEYPGDSREWEPPAEAALPPLVGMGGLKGHGKDAFADYLAQDHGYFKTFMSEPLTQALSLIGPRGPWVRLDFDVPGGARAGEFIRYAALVELVGYTDAKKHRDAREYLQGLGTEVGRNMIGESTWTDIALEKIRTARAAGHPVVITGIRYPNELELIRGLGGLNVWIDRPQQAPQAHPLTDAIDEALGIKDSTETHSSETTLSAEDFDAVIENYGSLDDLRATAQRFALEQAAGGYAEN